MNNNENRLHAGPPTRSRVPHRTSVGVLALLLGILATLTVQPSQAWAAWNGRIGYTAATSVGGTETIGTLKPTGYSEQVVCIDALLEMPASMSSPSMMNDATLGYVMGRYSQSTDPDVAAAVWYIIGEKLNSHWDWALSAFNNLPAATRTRILTLVNQYKGEAASLAGGYSIPIAMASTPGTIVGTVDNIGVTGAGGGLYAGLPITIVLSGGAVWTSNGAASITVTSTAGYQSLQWRATSASASIAADASVPAGSLPGTQIGIHPAPQSGDQRMVSRTLDTASGFDPYGSEVGFMPRYSSQVSAATLPVGAAFGTDAVTIAGGQPGASLDVQLTVYGPLANIPSEGAQVPAGSPVFETITQTVTFDGSGNASTSFAGTKATTAAGAYVAVESNAQVGLFLASSGTFGRSSETSTRWALPTITTKVSSQLVVVGTSVSDTATLGGVEELLKLAPGFKVTVTGKALGPVAPKAGSCEGLDWSSAATVVTIPATVVTKDGDLANLGAFKPAVAQCFSYGETVTVTDTAGKVVGTVTHEAGQVPQTVIVVPTVTVTTKTSAQLVQQGATITDTATLTGVDEILAAAPKAQITLTGTLVSAEPINGSCTDVDWTKATEVQKIAATPVTKSGDMAGLGSYRAMTLVCLSYGERVVVMLDGKELTSTDHPVGQVPQTTLVKAPNPVTIATQVSAQKIIAGKAITDTVQVTGVDAILATLPEAVVTMNGKIYSAVPVSGSCTGVDWTTATVVATIPDTTITKDGTLTGVGPYTPSGVMCLSYAEGITVTLSGKVLTSTDHPVGQVSQTTLVRRGGDADSGDDSLIPSGLAGPNPALMGGAIVLLLVAGASVVGAVKTARRKG